MPNRHWPTYPLAVKVGVVVVTHKTAGFNHIPMTCNNGRVINSGWQIDAASVDGYDRYDVEVSRDHNGTAVFVTLRGILVAYLCGEDG